MFIEIEFDNRRGNRRTRTGNDFLPSVELIENAQYDNELYSRLSQTLSI